MPNRIYWQSDDEKIGHDVGHDDALQDQDLVHAVTDTFQRPLLLDRVAKEDEDKCEDQSPTDDDRHDAVNPPLELDGERPQVEKKLAHLQACQRPEVYQREGERKLLKQMTLLELDKYRLWRYCKRGGCHTFMMNSMLFATIPVKLAW